MKKLGIVIVSLILIFAMTITSASAAAKPGKVKVTKKTATAKSVTLQWKKAKNAKKYEIQQQKAKKFKKIKTVKKTKVVIKKLKANTKYKFRIRAVKGRKKGKFTKVTVRTKKPSKAQANNKKRFSPVVTPTKPNSRTPKNHSHVWNTYYRWSETQHKVYCSGCWGYKLEDHKMGKWIVTTPATANWPYSYEARSCTLCDYEETRSVYVKDLGNYNPNPGNGDNGSNGGTGQNDISFKLPNDFEMYAGDIKGVEPSFNLNASDIEFKSSNTNIATVDDSGYITGKSKGTATITATYKKDRSINDSCEVTVKDMSISLSDYSANLKALPKGCPTSYSNDWKKTIAVNKTSIDNRTIYAKAKNESIAKCKYSQVNSNNQFEVQAVGSGETTIEVYVYTEKVRADGYSVLSYIPEKKILKTLTVSNSLLEVPVKSLDVGIAPINFLWIGQRPSSEYIHQRGETKSSNIYARVNPSYATNWNVVSYTSNDTNILTVDSQGNVTPKNKGVTTVTVKIKDCNGDVKSKTTGSVIVNNITYAKEGSQTYIEGGVLKDCYDELNRWRADSDNWWHRDRDNNIFNWEGNLNPDTIAARTAPLKRSTKLEAKCQERAKETWYMYFNEDGSINQNYKPHTRPDGSSCWTIYTKEEKTELRPGAENVSFGWSGAPVSAEGVIEAFAEKNEDYDGQGHRRAMQGSYKSVGIGYYYHDGKNICCMHFSDIELD